MAFKPISDYGVIGNMVSAALVARDGSIDWCCLPRFNSPSIFAAVLDDEQGGRFRIRPESPFESTQQYLSDTNVLSTSFKTATGSATVIDFMPRHGGGRRALPSAAQIHRIVRCDEGSIEMEAVFQPRLDYGRGATSLTVSRYGVVARKNGDSVVLSSTHDFELHAGTAMTRLALNAGQGATFVLRYGADEALAPLVHRSEDRLCATVDFWRDLARTCTCEGTWRDAIVRSFLTLHLLVYLPGGSIIAAATTSLPEEIGGERNWDYRFSWLRDASVTLDAFSRLGHKDEAIRYMNWLLLVCAVRGADGQILYGIEPTDDLEERTLDHLSGYRNSRPVRIGNGAYRQRQLDVFGEVLEAAYNYTTIGGYISADTWRLLRDYVEAAVRLWREPDNGIWEVRGGPFHFVHSKMMCWVAVDRGIRIAGAFDYGADDLDRWRAEATQIREDIQLRGWSDARQAFTQHYDTGTLDASALLMPLLGFLPADDRRMATTIERVASELTVGGLVRRYRTEETEDGLMGSEGAFLWCSFWLVRNLIRLNRLDEARRLYERLLAYRNHVGVYSEMVDGATGEALGNTPQALSHLGVIIAGLELADALQLSG